MTKLNTDKETFFLPNENTLLSEVELILRECCSARPWTYILLDVFVSMDESFRYLASFCEYEHSHWQSFRVDNEAASIIEKTFLKIHRYRLHAPSSAWNKARFILDHHKGFDTLRCHFDPDYEWLESLDPESDIYTQLTIQDELAILSWEGREQGKTRPKDTKVTCHDEDKKSLH